MNETSGFSHGSEAYSFDWDSEDEVTDSDLESDQEEEVDTHVESDDEEEEWN